MQLIYFQEFVSLMDYVEKLVTSAAETAFLAGAEPASTLMCERLNSALTKVTNSNNSVFWLYYK